MSAGSHSTRGSPKRDISGVQGRGGRDAVVRSRRKGTPTEFAGSTRQVHHRGRSIARRRFAIAVRYHPFGASFMAAGTRRRLPLPAGVLDLVGYRVPAVDALGGGPRRAANQARVDRGWSDDRWRVSISRAADHGRTTRSRTDAPLPHARRSPRRGSRGRPRPGGARSRCAGPSGNRAWGRPRRGSAGSAGTTSRTGRRVARSPSATPPRGRGRSRVGAPRPWHR